ncbi:hypothetical protein OD350_28920 (plasmid) [Clostridium beijerinckii]|uniref:hypothetical protein n=1 Tax=Clostridium beijerinckii TaxID=1520 RepID=UPI0022280C0E|nr:hypothetical protein [Clostridium beijerinckii]UYZ39098.1 hypothetical protein OD350_28920 [Clostridium beijerinckii]
MKVVSKNIEMVAYFNNGKIEPLKFRIKEENKYMVVKIKKIINYEKEKMRGNNMLKFTCTAIIEDVEKIFEIKYDINNTLWFLYKI